MRWSARELRRTTLLTIGCSLFLVGLAAAKLVDNQQVLIWSLVIFCLGCLVLLRKRKNFLLFTLFLTALLGLGLWRGSVYNKKLDSYNKLFRQSVVLEVTSREDAVYGDKTQLTFAADHIKVIEPYKTTLVGNVEVAGLSAPMVYRGDTVRVTGKLFPKRGDNHAGVSFATITMLHKSSSKVDVIRRKFTAGLQNVLPEPLASLSLGLLIGQRNTLPNDLKTQLTNVSLIHIVAVSGYNLTIIIYVVQRLLQKRSRFQALVGSFGLMILFLLLTGFSPSISRAAVVSTVSLVMWYYGRNMKPMLILLLSAVITTAINPLYLWSSVGWYLSFAAFFGVLVLGPLLEERFVKKSWRGKLVPDVLCETIAAQICTLPVIIYTFGTLSVVGIVANVLVVPLVPAAMLASLIAGLYGMVPPFIFGGLLVLPARILLEYIVYVVSLLSSLPFASISIAISLKQMIIMYGALILVTILLALRNKPSRNSGMPGIALEV